MKIIDTVALKISFPNVVAVYWRLITMVASSRGKKAIHSYCRSSNNEFSVFYISPIRKSRLLMYPKAVIRVVHLKLIFRTYFQNVWSFVFSLSLSFSISRSKIRMKFPKSSEEIRQQMMGLVWNHHLWAPVSNRSVHRHLLIHFTLHVS